MATIFSSGERVLAGPFQFLWRTERTYGLNAPNVVIFGREPDLASIVGGEQLTASRGSTAQLGVVVTLAAPGGGAGTKTNNELAADFNAVFGIASGAPTDFAYPGLVLAFPGLVLVDATVGLNTGLAAIVGYIGATPTIQAQVCAMVGIPVILKEVGAPAISSIDIDAGYGVRNNAAISSNFMSIPVGTRELVLAFGVGNRAAGSIDQPLFSLIWEDASGIGAPPYDTLDMTIVQSVPSSDQIAPYRSYMTGSPIVFRLDSYGVRESGILLPVFTRFIRVPISPMWTKVRLSAPFYVSGNNPATGYPFIIAPSLQVTAWAVGG